MNLDEVLALSQPMHFRFRGIAQWQSAVEDVTVEVNHYEQTWRATRNDTGYVSFYADGHLHNGDEVVPSRTYRDKVGLATLRLVFPERLPVWGRGARDSDRPLRSERLSETEVLVTLESLQERSVRKTIVIDEKLGIVNRYNDLFCVSFVHTLTDLETGEVFTLFPTG